NPVPVPTEGGHIDFAPRNAVEFGLLEYLRQRFGRVSYDRVVSGPGLHHIYMYFRDADPRAEQDWLGERIAAGDPAAEIAKAALDGSSELAVRSMDLFVSMYGAMAGNLALMFMATRGVYVGGGIAPKILKKLKDGAFLASFTQKGRFAAMMEKIPVRVILEPKTALYGAARIAASL
ncbi:MAG TPA: glucokinase, partial [Blastocatellia bacterium]|nr:glucokinase [Blastocatellia bacterium]